MSVVGRSTTHRPSGVGPQVGLGGLESQRVDGGAGDVVEVEDGGDADASL